MSKPISPKIVSLTFGILTTSFLAVFYVVAWQEPTDIPPGGNVSAPLNSSNIGQSKEGGLILGTNCVLPCENALIIDKGNICIGADCRDSWPVGGGVIITYDMVVHSELLGSTYYARSVSYTCPEGSAVQTYCKTIIMAGRESADFNACGCSVSGGTATLTQYVSKCTCTGTCSCVADSSCTPYSRFWGQVDCYKPAEDCAMEFQCGIRQRVGD